MIDRWPRRALLWAGLAVGVLLAAALIDHSVTYDGLPEIDNFAEASQADLEEREDASDAFVVRAWLYAVGVTIAVGALVAAALRSAAPEQRRDIFRDLGVAGVLFLFAGWYVYSREPYLISDSSSEGLMVLPAIAMLVAAAVGGIAVRSSPEGGGESLDAKSWLASVPRVALAAVGLTALTLLLVLIAQPGSECGDDAPGRSGTLLGIALLTGAAAGVCGLIALFKRRWLAALVSIPAPAVGLFAIVVSACLE